jgi:hypothetical protein
VTDDAIEPGLVLIDAPDIDSLEHANRALTDRLVEAADLCVFVTTATRYADQVPWSVLARVQERGLPLLVVVNRMPPDPDDQQEVLADVRRLLAEAASTDCSRTAATPRHATSSPSERETWTPTASGSWRPPSRRCSTRSRGCVPIARRASRWPPAP